MAIEKDGDGNLQFSITKEELNPPPFEDDGRVLVRFPSGKASPGRVRYRAGMNLPKSAVEEIGVTNLRDNVVYDLPFLSIATHRYLAFRDSTEPIEYHQGFEVEQDKDEFISSIKSIIESFYPRLFKTARLPDDSIVEHPSLKTIRDRLYMDLRRRIKKKMWIVDKGPAASDEDVKGKKRDLFGKRWTFKDTPFEDLGLEAGEDHPLPVVLCSVVPDEGLLERKYCPVLSYCEQLVAQRFKLYEEFSRGETQTGLKNSGRRSAKYLQWQKEKQRRGEASKRKSRHISIGAFRPGETNLDNERGKEIRSCTIPYLVAEIDGPGAEASLGYARLLLKQLQTAGADLDVIVAAFSGRRSFHLRIPMGMVGNPVFRDTPVATKLVRRFFKSVSESAEENKDDLLSAKEAEMIRDGSGLNVAFFDGIEPTNKGPSSLFEVLDGAMFSPNHLIRAIGSIHEKTGQFCVGFSGTELLETSLWKVKAYSKNYSGFRLEKPSEAAMVPALVEILQNASRAEEKNPDTLSTSSSHQDGDGVKSAGIIDAIKDGVARGEEYLQGEVGRNRAALQYSIWALSHSDSQAIAWKKVCTWNRKNSPPLGNHPTDEEDELRNVFRRAIAYLP